MFNKKKYIDNEVFEKNKVKLKSYFNIHPFVCYCIKVILAILAIGFFPSLLTQSRRVYISTSSYPVRVLIDGVDCGVSPVNLRLIPGKHKVLLKYSDLELAEQNIFVKPALMFSYIFEYSKKVFCKIDITDELIKSANKILLQDAIDYSYLFKIDNIHIQKPYFSYYKTLLGDRCNKDILDICKKFIANQDCAQDYKKNFDNSYNFSMQSDYLIDSNLQDDNNILNYQWEIIDVAGREFVKVSPLLAISATISGVNATVVQAKEACREFSEQYGVSARLLDANEYYNIAKGTYNDNGKRKMFRDFPFEFNEITSNIFTPSGVLLTQSEQNILEKYDIRLNYRLFAGSKFNNIAGLNNLAKCRLFGLLREADAFESVGFRIALDL